jgi:hypothetical protein
MNIFIDESGSFVNSSNLSSWNCVAAYIMPESIEYKSKKALAVLKSKTTTSTKRGGEIKLRDTSEHDYFQFLTRLGNLDGVLFAAVTDAGRNDLADIHSHQKEQAAKLRANIPLMIYEEGKQAVGLLADQLEALSPQLYVQLHLQVDMIFDIILRALLYFVQRDPRTLRRFKWRIDQKNSSKTVFEDTFEKFAPALLQTKSLYESFDILEGADYSALAPYEYGEGEIPTYLTKATGIEIEHALNIGKLLRKDLEFEDSKRSEGIQIVDLLASGIRRCLRNGFDDNQTAAQLLGRLMVQGQKQRPPVKVIGFNEVVLPAASPVAKAINAMIKYSRSMVI